MDNDPVQPKMVPCKYCGKTIPETTNFCWYCGRELIARPERPEVQSSNSINAKTLIIIGCIIAVIALGLVIWSSLQ